MADTLKKMKIVIIVLAVLLGLSLTALAGVILYSRSILNNGLAVVSDNYIDPGTNGELGESTESDGHMTPVMLRASASNAKLSCGIPMMTLSKVLIASDSAKETVISIYKTHAEDSTAFYLPNMFPGDSETKTYLVEVSHRGTVTVRFHADIRSGYEKLAEVLKCKVVLREEKETLYDGLMRDMPESINHRISSVFGKTTELTYDITVYLDTSVGNEYMNQELIADFRWWVEESGGTPSIPTLPPETTEAPEPDVTTEPDETTAPTVTTEPDETTEPVVTTEPDETTEPVVTTEPDETIEPVVTTEPEYTTEPEETTDPDDGELIYPPETGDIAHLCIWFWIAMVSVLINIILLWPTRRRFKREMEEDMPNE